MRRSLGAKLLVAQLLVVLAGSLTLLLVAGAAGPWLFDRHLQRRLQGVPDTITHHAHAAFEEALTTSLGAAITAATLTAVIASAVLTRRIVAPIRELAAGARAIAAGRLDTRVQVQGDDELATLATSFNAMAQRLADTERTRTRLVGDVAHELRTPLATLDGYLEGLADGVITPTDDTWETLRTQTRRMARLADDLALVSRAEEGRLDLRMRPTDPNEVLASAVSAVGPLAERAGVSLLTALPQQLPTIPADPERLLQVLGNLLDNAVRHTPARGCVTVSADATDDTVRVTITDTGDGIPPAEIERIFTRFHRVDAARTAGTGGSGIGLTVARAIADAHGGHLEASSAGPGTGATFTLTLPVEETRPSTA
ncbi:MAG: ATP-binding protein [Thermoleophilia bacterium]